MEKFGYELLDIPWISLTAFPLLIYALKESIWVIELSTLKLYHPLRVRSHKETNNVTWTAIVSSVKIPFLFWKFIISRFKVVQAFFVNGSNRQTKISKNSWICQVEHRGLKILYDPRINRILGEVLSASLGVSI